MPEHSFRSDIFVMIIIRISSNNKLNTCLLFPELSGHTRNFELLMWHSVFGSWLLGWPRRRAGRTPRLHAHFKDPLQRCCGDHQQACLCEERVSRAAAGSQARLAHAALPDVTRPPSHTLPWSLHLAFSCPGPLLPSQQDTEQTRAACTYFLVLSLFLTPFSLKMLPPRSTFLQRVTSKFLKPGCTECLWSLETQVTIHNK